MSAAIVVDGLGKEYPHYAKTQRARYATLKDTIEDFVRLQCRRLVRGRVHSAGETLWALKDVSFNVDCGEVVGLIGRNGSGKSTLLRILSRITTPTHGEARIRGRVGSLLEVGTGFHPELTGRENILFTGVLLGMGQREVISKVDEIVEFAGVEAFVNTPTKYYSSGMVVRLAFAVAAHLLPEVVLLDEVLAVGDESFQNKCAEKIRDITASGRTVLLVTHNMTSVRQHCHRAILLAQGTVINVGDSSEVVAQYLDSPVGSAVPLSYCRMPGMSPIVKHVRLHELQDNGGGTLNVFSPLTVELEYQLPDESVDVTLSILVESEDGDLLFANHSPPRALANGRRRCYAVCRIGSVPLAPGRYFVTIACFHAGIQIDHLHRAMAFRIVANTGCTLSSWRQTGYFIVDADWEWEPT